MSLGRNINRLRTAKNMSQGDLADALGVSRQSISKWETDASVPELDKLIRLSSIFEVSLDELVKGTGVPAQEAPPAPETHAQPAPPQGAGWPKRKTAGAVLFGLSFLVCMLFAAGGGLPGILAGLVFSSPLWLCGIVCFVCKRHTGLYCAWAVFFAVDTYLRYGTGVTFRLTRATFAYEPSMNYMRLVMSWCQLMAVAALITATVLAYRKEPICLTGKKQALFIACCVAFILLHIPVSLGFELWYRLVLAAFDAAKVILLTVLLSALARWLYQRRSAERQRIPVK